MILHKNDRECRFYIFCSGLMDLTAFLHIRLKLEPQPKRRGMFVARAIIFGKPICSRTLGLALPFRSHGSSLGASCTSGSSGGSRDTRHLLVGRSYQPAVEKLQGSTISMSLVRRRIVRAPCSNCLRAQHRPRVVSQFLPAGLRVKPAADLQLGSYRQRCQVRQDIESRNAVGVSTEVQQLWLFTAGCMFGHRPLVSSGAPGLTREGLVLD